MKETVIESNTIYEVCWWIGDKKHSKLFKRKSSAQEHLDKVNKGCKFLGLENITPLIIDLQLNE